MALIGGSWPLGLSEATVPIAEDIVDASCRNYDSGVEHGDEISCVNQVVITAYG